MHLKKKKMPMINNKTRSIKSLPILNNTTSFIQNSFDSYLGESISDNLETSVNSSSTNTSDLEEELGIALKLSDLSSSSSLSWNEDYEKEINHKILIELEKLDNIFQGDDADETNDYDREEISEWKKFFPNIYILGRTTPVNIDEESNSEDEYSKSSQKSDKMQNSHHLYHSLPRKPKSFEFSKFLEISPIKSSNLRCRRRTDGSLNNETPEYLSLPILSATSRSRNNNNNRTAVHAKNHREEEKFSKLFLPPIQTNFRSISAIPNNRQITSSSIQSFYNQKSEASKFRSDLLKFFDHVSIHR